MANHKILIEGEELDRTFNWRTTGAILRWLQMQAMSKDTTANSYLNKIVAREKRKQQTTNVKRK